MARLSMSSVSGMFSRVLPPMLFCAPKTDLVATWRRLCFAGSLIMIDLFSI